MLSCGIVGLPLTGKTTFFRLLTGVSQGGRGEAPGKGVAKIPDRRVSFLAGVYLPKKTTHAQIEFVDVPGFAPGTGQGGRFLAEAREVDALVQVLRAFPLGGEEADPLADLEAIHLELVLADLEFLEKRLERGRGNKKARPVETALLERCRSALEDGRTIRSLGFSPEEERELAGYALLTEKPYLVVANVAEEGFRRGDYPGRDQLRQRAEGAGLPFLETCAQLEEEIQELPAQEREEFLRDLGVAESGIERVARGVYTHLGLMSFLTAGEDEVRAWTIKSRTAAKEAAGKIHSDIERGFIRAEVVAFDDFVAAGSLAGARDRGTLRLEGKEYQVRDGDIVNFRFNVTR